jgi:large subunit ribosomal protein L25
MVPAVIYGDKKDPVSIVLPYKELSMKLHGGGFMNTIATIKVDGDEYRVLPKDYQLEPVRDFILHVDFLRVSKNTIVTVEIPVHFENEETCPGLKSGGVLNVVRFAVEVNCPADAIPDSFTIDLAPFELGDSINISSVTLPEGVEPTITDRDFTIATIASPAGLKSDEEEEEGAPEAPETEVIGEEKEEGGEEEE